MEARTTTNQARLAEALERAYDHVQEAHSALYDVSLAYERLGLDADDAAARDHCDAGREEVHELRMLLAPVARWLRRVRAEVGTHGG